MNIKFLNFQFRLPKLYLQGILIALFIYFSLKAAYYYSNNLLLLKLLPIILILGLYFCLTKPYLTFYIFIFTLPFMDILRFNNIEFLSLPNFLGFFVLLLYLFQIAKNKKLVWIKTSLDLPLLILLIIFLVSALQSRLIASDVLVLKYSFFNQPYFRSIFQIITLVFCIILYYLTLILINNKEEFIRVLKIWIYTILFNCFLGLYGFFGKFLSLPYSDFFVTTVSHFPRVQIFCREPLIFGLYLITFIPLLVVIIINKKHSIDSILPLPVIKWSLFLILLVLLATFARGAWLGLFFSMIIISFYYWKENKSIRSLFAGGIIIGVIFLLLNELLVPIFLPEEKEDIKILQRMVGVFTGEDFSTLNRLDTVIAAWNMFKAYPLLGVGYGNYHAHYLNFVPDFHWSIFTWAPYSAFPNAHNIFANYLAETGILGCLAVIILIFSIILSYLKTINLAKNTFYYPYLIALFSAFIGIMVVYQFFSTLSITFIWIFLGIMISAQKLALKETAKTLNK
ncbi:MAG: O-antigen ligase family protein [Armatimonadetes bacterium]|nr:O-antigen ligase family protein [Armatimonadota bacterium]